MTTETVLSLEQIDNAQSAAFNRLVDHGYSGGMGGLQWDRASARAIEQAVLQSPEVVAWKKDAETLGKACRVAVLALAHASQEHGEIYRKAYREVDAALQEVRP